VAFLAVLVLVGCGGASPLAARNQAPDSPLLKLAFVPGTTTRYSLDVTSDGITGVGGPRPEPFSREVTAEEIDHVVSVARNGYADLDVDLTTLSARPLPVIGPPQMMRITVAPNGQLVSGSLMSGLPARTPLVPIFNTRSLVDLPDHPVRPGATWTTRVTAETQGLPFVLQYDTQSRFDRVETVGNTRAAVIVSKARFDLAGVTTPSPTPDGQLTMRFSGPADVTATYWLDLAAHQLIKIRWEANVDSTLTVEDSATARMTQRIEAVRSRAATA
jgi:hypothetical protein